MLAQTLRSDRYAYCELSVPEPHVLELRELSRSAEELTRERVRLKNRMANQLWRYYPQILDLSDDVAQNWVLDLWEIAPTPEKARRITRPRIEKILRGNRIRRMGVEEVREILRGKSIAVAPGTAEAAALTIRMLIARLRLNGRQLKEVNAEIDQLLEEFGEGSGQRDAEILRSVPGVGRTTLATLLAEANDPIRRRDYAALRALCGSAPVTKRSGKGIIVVRRMAVHNRLRNACHYIAGSAIQHDPRSRLRYDALRERGCNHSRALRTVADRLLAVMCAMLAGQTLYDPAHAARREVA